jgi:hypothetical protein
MRSGAAQLTERAPDAEDSDRIGEVCYVGKNYGVMSLA